MYLIGRSLAQAHTCRKFVAFSLIAWGLSAPRTAICPYPVIFNPEDRLAKAKAGLNLVRKKAGLRYAMSTVPLDARHVRGTHGRLPGSRESTPLVISSEQAMPPFAEELMRLGKQIPAAAVKSLVLQTQGLPE